ncbi:MAG: S8 family serine peptidase [Actinobacteria bacterium]|nr:S8 family serine peptidase [Actinomycetota bacterium]
MPAYASAPRTEVVVTLDAPSLALATSQSRVLTKAARTRRLDLRTPTSVTYLRGLAAAQRTLQSRIGRILPDANVRWHYSIVLNALAVDVPVAQVTKLSSVRGVDRVYPSVRYHAVGHASTVLNQTPQLIGAPALWGPSLTTAGNGMKIGIVDDGVNQTHPFLSPTGLAMPSGYPKGNASFTTAKVIVARAFPPASPKYVNANLPFDPTASEHATHVAGIAAGDHGTIASGGVSVSGIAPKAYLGNYKVLTIPTVSGVGLDGNSPEIAKGIESAVADGMDVINLSLGEPEIEITRDIVVKAIDGAAAAGVVPAIAAGNDFDAFGRGSVGSPGSAPRAITSAAVSKSKVIASFSSGGPTPVSLQMKPDVSAPGVSVLSSIPAREGLWAEWSGTSMASPHVAGAAALLRQLHPTWTVEQIKSALVLTGTPVYTSASHSAETTPAREGGGLITLPAADHPLIFAAPTGLSFGLLRGSTLAVRSISLTDAGGGAGQWQVAIDQRQGPPGGVTAPSSVQVPGTLDVHVAAAGQGSEVTGFVVLTKGSDSRRLPFWFRIESPQLPRQAHGTLKKTGTYKGNTKGRQSLVDAYRYPDNPASVGIPVNLGGPEQVFTVKLDAPVANFGVAILSQGPSVAIQPRVVAEDDENRLTGYPALPFNLNPYVVNFYKPTSVSGAILPVKGTYDVVFDSTSSLDAGAFTFRFWINDVARPSARLLTRKVKANGSLQIKVTDAGSGVDPESISASIDGVRIRPSYSRKKNRVTISTRGLARRSHLLVLQVSDYQETRNMENVGPILPNTRTLATTFRIR